MRHSIGLAWVAGFLIAGAAPLQAQTEVQQAAEIFKKWQTAPPAPARVDPPRVDPPRVETTRRTTIVVPQREIVVIERVQARPGWWRNPRYQVITVYYDGARFYRRPFDRRPLRKVAVYQRAGRYYIDEGQWRREHRLHYGRDYRWNDSDRRRHDDKWNDDGRGRRDDRWMNDDKRRDDDRWRGDDRRKDDHDKDGQNGNNGRHLGHDKDKDKDKDKD
jgi:hypothetical protein